MTPLDWYPRPSPDTGLGLHDSSSTGARPGDEAAHARALVAAGVRWYKVLADGPNKVDLARTYQGHGIQVIARLYAERPNHRDASLAFVPDPAHVRAYVAAGVRYFEYSNEKNVGTGEWRDGIEPPHSAWGQNNAIHWTRASDLIKREGGIPLLEAQAPEGTYSHRRILTETIAALRAMGRMDTFERAGIAIHPRPHNNPPDTPYSDGNTVTFDEWRWFRDTLKRELGWCPPLFATEHGYAIGDAQNGEFPRIDEARWRDFNREVFLRMDPDHPKALDEELFALCYWLEAYGGTWAGDEAFRDWLPGGARAWGQALLDLHPGWNRAGEQGPPDDDEEPPVPSDEREMVNVPEWVTVTDASVAPGAQYWRLAKVEYQDDQQSGGKHHIYAQVPHDPSVQMLVSNGSQAWLVALDKPDGEPAANFPMWSGNVYSAQLQERPSDRIEGLHLPANHHVSYLLWWELATAGDGGGDEGAGETLAAALLARGEAEQLIRFNPEAALQKVIFQQGFVPNSPEFTITFDGTPYVGQRAERLSDGEVKVFYARHGDWGNVRSVTRP